MSREALLLSCTLCVRHLHLPNDHVIASHSTVVIDFSKLSHILSSNLALGPTSAFVGKETHKGGAIFVYLLLVSLAETFFLYLHWMLSVCFDVSLYFDSGT